jgi:hypothetical protein
MKRASELRKIVVRDMSSNERKIHDESITDIERDILRLHNERKRSYDTIRYVDHHVGEHIVHTLEEAEYEVEVKYAYQNKTPYIDLRVKW